MSGDIITDNLSFKKVHTTWAFIPVPSEFIFILPLQFLQEFLPIHPNLWLGILFPSVRWTFVFYVYICFLSSFLPSPLLLSSLLNKLLLIFKDRIVTPYAVKISLSEMLSHDASALPQLPTFTVTPWDLTSWVPLNHSFTHCTIQWNSFNSSSLANENNTFSIVFHWDFRNPLTSPVSTMSLLSLPSPLFSPDSIILLLN